MKPRALPHYTALTFAARRSTASAIIALFLLALGQVSASAQIMISDFVMSSNSVSFGISGTFPSSAPPWAAGTLYFVNPDAFASPGFTLTSDFNGSSTASFTGSQPLRPDGPGVGRPIATGSESFGDYFYVAFQTNFAVGEAINGSVLANWSSPAFAVGAVSSLNVFWGGATNRTAPANSGTLLTTVGVPEPSTYALLLMTGAGALWLARRRRR